MPGGIQTPRAALIAAMCAAGCGIGPLTTIEGSSDSTNSIGFEISRTLRDMENGRLGLRATWWTLSTSSFNVTIDDSVQGVFSVPARIDGGVCRIALDSEVVSPGGVASLTFSFWLVSVWYYELYNLYPYVPDSIARAETTSPLPLSVALALRLRLGERIALRGEWGRAGFLGTNMEEWSVLLEVALSRRWSLLAGWRHAEVHETGGGVDPEIDLSLSGGGFGLRASF